MPLNVSLTPHFETLIRQKVSSGQYGSASEVVREAMRLFEEQDSLRTMKLKHLRQDIKHGIDSGESTPWNKEEVRQLGRQKLAAASGTAQA